MTHERNGSGFSNSNSVTVDGCICVKVFIFYLFDLAFLSFSMVFLLFCLILLSFFLTFHF